MLGIALLTVRAADASLARRERSALFEVDEAVEFVATALPDELTGRLTYADVEAVVTAHLELLGEDDAPAGAIVHPDMAVTLTRTVQARGHDVQREDVDAVLRAEVAYLDAIGALEQRGDLGAGPEGTLGDDPD